MIKTVLIENEDNGMELLKSLIKSEAPDFQVVGEAGSNELAVPLIVRTKPDVLFLDIELDDGTAFELLDQFENPPFKIVFVTSHDHYAIKAIKKSAYDYLLKPLSPSDIKEVSQKLITLLSCPSSRKEEGLTEDCERTLFFSDGKKYRVCSYDDILFMASFKPYTKIYFKDASSLLSSDPLKSFPDSLPSYFFMIHRSYLINIKFVERVNLQNLEVKLRSGQNLPLAHRRVKEFLLELKKLRQNVSITDKEILE